VGKQLRIVSDTAPAAGKTRKAGRAANTRSPVARGTHRAAD